MELESGIFIPGFVNADAGATSSSDFYNVSLRAGVVLKSYAVTEPSNVNKVYTEYDVRVTQADGLSVPSDRIYRHVIVGSLFGGVADYLRWTPRIEPYEKGTKVNYGAKVLLLCLNGNSQKSYIIGGLPHPNGTPDSDYSEHEFKLEQNGINVNINKDGDLVITHKGATNADGTVIDKAQGNAVLSMTKDGNVLIGYATSEGDKPQIAWNKQENSITVHGNAKIRIEANSGPVEIVTSDGVKINGATEAFIKGTTYREKEKILHQSLSQLLEVLGSLATAAGSALTANSPTTAGPIISSMNSVFSQMQSAIKTFETDDYLSKKHFHED